MNRKLAFDNRLCYERDVARQHAVHQRKIEEVLVTSQSASKAFLDSNAPAPQRHLATNAKRLQLERDKQLDIFHQNQRLASKMERISHRQENLILFAMGRGDACKKPSLVNRAVQKRRQATIEVENRRLKERLGRLKPYYDTKKWDDEWQDHAHKFNHLHQDGTVGYLLPPPSKKSMPSSRGGCKTSRERGTTRRPTPASRGLPSLGGNRRSVSRGDRLQQQQSIRLKPVSGSSESSAETGRDGDAELEEEEEMQVRELAPFTLLEATTRQGVAIVVNELEIEVLRAPITCPGVIELGDRFVNEQVRKCISICALIKLETVSQVPNAGNIPRLSTLLTEDELQKLLLGVVQHLRFQVTPTTPNTSQLVISNSEHQRDAALLYDDDDEMTCAIDGDVDPLEIDWAVRFKMASMLNLEGRRWRTILRKDSGIYLVSSWFEEETGVQTIKIIAVGKAAMETMSWVVEVVYDLSEMEALMRQVEGGTLTVPELLAEKVTHVLP
ncbi:hypothetical protein BBJ28_00004802 [Nothophytophthora sp. Chile5]|nr:hypothetical protein BBJ28_00004802 [Nothophytophthora sp. Chile5]